MIKVSKELLKQELDALKKHRGNYELNRKETLAQKVIEDALIAAIAQPADGNRTSVDSGALKLALNVLRRAGKDATADALHDTATREPIAQPAPLRAKTLIEMVDDAMVEMVDIHPPLRRSECQRLILAAISQPVPLKEEK